MGRRIWKNYKQTTTHWHWDGSVPLHEWKGFVSKDPLSENLITWVFEEDSFSPIAKLRGEKKYSILADHLGTPIEMYQDDGSLFWERQLNANGKTIKETQQGSCPFLFQGQYYDTEIELAYNRFRYYDPEDGRYISQDPIGLLGGLLFYGYVHDSNVYSDPLGLSSTALNTALGGSKSGMQAHHIIPEKVWNDPTNSQFLNDIGLGSQRDAASNGLHMYDSESLARQNGKAYYHRGRHDDYSKKVNARLKEIRDDYKIHKDKVKAKAEVERLQKRLRNVLDRDSKQKNPRRVGYKKK